MVAFGQLAYLAQATLALDSIRTHSKLPVSLFTDQPDHLIVKDAGYDNIEHLQVPVIPGLPHEFAAPLLARVIAMCRSPYTHTLSLDVDARVKQPEFDHIFDICERADLAATPCLPDTSRERVMYDRPIFNNGVIVYRKNATTSAFLEQFERQFRSHLNIACSTDASTECLSHITDPTIRKRLLCSDQIAMAQLLSPVVNQMGLSYAHLPEHWNWRGGNPQRVCAEEIIINHHPDLRNGTFDQLAASAFDKLVNGQVGRSSLYYNIAIQTLDPQLTKLNISEHLAQLNQHQELRSVLEFLPANNYNVNSASLLAVANFHCRNKGQIHKAQAVLQKLIKEQSRN